MKTSAVKFRNDLKEGLLDFIWQQWCRLGIGGASPAKTLWIIDPEALLAFTSEMARHDARLFDQVLDWLAVNGGWINTQRLSTIMKQDGIGCTAVVGAVASRMCELDKSAKWRGLAKRNQPDKDIPVEPLFQLITNPGQAIDMPDRHFQAYGLLREEVHTRGMAQAVNLNDGVNIIFKSRALFGVSIRADIMAYLLTNEGGHARKIAELLGYNHMRVNEILSELEDAGFIRVRPVGKAKQYSIDRALWTSALCLDKTSTFRWLSWRPLARGLTAIWRVASAIDESRADDYIVSSKMREAMRMAREDIYASGLPVELTNDTRFKAEDYLPVLTKDLINIIDALNS